MSERESILKQTPKKPGDMQHGFIENTLIHRTRHTITIQRLPASQANKKVPVANSMKHCYLNCKFLELHFLLCIKLSEENRTIIFLDRWAFTLLHPRHITGEQTFPYNTILEHKDFYYFTDWARRVIKQKSDPSFSILIPKLEGEEYHNID